MRYSWLVGHGEFLEQAFHAWRQDRPDDHLERVAIVQGEDYEFDMTGFDRLDPALGDVFIAVDDRFGNFKRQELMQEALRRGFQLLSFVHSSAVLGQDVAIGEGVFVGPGAIIGYRCDIGKATVIQAGAHIGAHSTLAPLCWLDQGVQLGTRVVLGSHCTVRMGALLASGVQVGRYCELGWPQLYRDNVPEKTVFDTRYDEPIHTYDFSDVV